MEDEEVKTKAGKIKRKLKNWSLEISDAERQKWLEIELDDKEIARKSKCTKCSAKYMKEGKCNNLHPLLKVPFCQKCSYFYGDGEFSLDEDDEDKYCRWCGEGGKIFLCSKCIVGFCPKCIKKHFGKDMLKSIEDDNDWECFVCKPDILLELRKIGVLASGSEKSGNNSNKSHSEDIRSAKPKQSLESNTKNKRESPKLCLYSDSESNNEDPPKDISTKDASQKFDELINSIEVEKEAHEKNAPEEPKKETKNADNKDTTEEFQKETNAKDNNAAIGNIEGECQEYRANDTEEAKNHDDDNGPTHNKGDVEFQQDGDGTKSDCGMADGSVRNEDNASSGGSKNEEYNETTDDDCNKDSCGKKAEKEMKKKILPRRSLRNNGSDSDTPKEKIPESHSKSSTVNINRKKRNTAVNRKRGRPTKIVNDDSDEASNKKRRNTTDSTDSSLLDDDKGVQYWAKSVPELFSYYSQLCDKRARQLTKDNYQGQLVKIQKAFCVLKESLKLVKGHLTNFK